MKKYWKALSSITLAALLLSACGTASNEPTNNDENTNGSGDGGYESPSDELKGELVTLEEVSANVQVADGKYTFTLTNTTDKEINFSFANTQEYEYTLTDSKGAHIYTYSMDKMFGEMWWEKTLQPNEQFIMDVDLEILSTFEPGLYTLEIWSVALEAEGLKAEMKIEVDSSSSKEIGVFIGQIDSNSVEILDETGTAKAFRLTEEVKQHIEKMDPDQEVKFSFYEENGQLILTTIEEK